MSKSRFYACHGTKWCIFAHCWVYWPCWACRTQGCQHNAGWGRLWSDVFVRCRWWGCWCAPQGSPTDACTWTRLQRTLLPPSSLQEWEEKRVWCYYSTPIWTIKPREDGNQKAELHSFTQSCLICLTPLGLAQFNDLFSFWFLARQKATH